MCLKLWKEVTGGHQANSGGWQGAGDDQEIVLLMPVKEEPEKDAAVGRGSGKYLLKAKLRTQCQENHTTSELDAVFYLNFHVTRIHGDLTVPSVMFTARQPGAQSRGAPSHAMLTVSAPTWLNPWWIWFSRLWLQVTDCQLKITSTTSSSPLPPLCPKVPEHSDCSVKSTGKARMGLVFHWDIPRRKKPLGQKNLSQIYTFKYIVYFPQHI